ncbi:hypothetical protein LEP1GSC016_4207 [Leptospira borgpetersenii serovar Hardjo-bovis str. Sponselee]|uniref:Uncharacterized protein n=1 Tax=Leptospira borgpetersenii serovar Hardjo-bovis str. Sponselee TaxID=1303729 RepID=M6BWI0_LEPBO|nr:hypothetical protein LEP1GSC016_4207 [Leptospira borgpetersenii serovar Hardjo-bovis str. Sponselee]
MTEGQGKICLIDIKQTKSTIGRWFTESARVFLLPEHLYEKSASVIKKRLCNQIVLL